MARHAQFVAPVTAACATVAYLYTDDDRWLAVAIAAMFVGVLFIYAADVGGCKCDRQQREDTVDLYWTDVERMLTASGELPVGTPAAEVMDAAFQRLDGHPDVCRTGIEARRRDWLGPAYLNGWPELQAQLDGRTPSRPCSCAAAGSTWLRDRDCPIHGVKDRHSW